MDDIDDKDIDLGDFDFTELDDLYFLDHREDGQCTDSSEDETNTSEIPSVVKNKIEVLIEIGKHSKIVSLKDGRDDFGNAFLKVISSDPDCKKYVGRDVMFKVRSSKFNTWVDYDPSEEVTDGMRFKAVFQSKSPSDISEKVHNRHRHRKEKHTFDSSDDFYYKKEEKTDIDLSKLRHKRKRSWKSSETDNRRSKYGRESSSKRVLTESDSDERSNCNRYVTNYHITHISINPQFQSVNNRFNHKLTQLKKYYSRPHRFRNTNEDENDISEGDYECEEIQHGSELDMKNSIISTQPSKASEGELYCVYLGLNKKNPISALHELCSRMSWKRPKFELIDHSFDGCTNSFKMQVTVNNVTYVPKVDCPKKQLAKASAAKLCLETLGIFKEDR